MKSRLTNLSPDERAWLVGASMLGMKFIEYKTRAENGEKWCCACRQWHPLEDFGVRRSTRTGLDNMCKKQITARVTVRAVKRGRIRRTDNPLALRILQEKSDA